MADAPTVRTFRPALVAPLGEGFVVVDELQPVAVFVDGRGRCSEPVSWRDLPPATEWWPPRSLFRDGSGVQVRDRPDGPTVRLDRTPDGLRVTTPSTLSGDSAREASVTVGDGSTDAVVLALGPGSVTCSAEATDGAAAVCVRRAEHRPWDFHPAHDLVVVPPGETAAVTVHGADIDITDLRWPRRPVDVRAVLAACLPTVLADCRAARENGAEDVRFTVRDLEHGPVVDIEFRRDGIPHIRTDEPLDELGRPCGLRAWSIFLEEDLLSGTPEPDADGVVRL